LSLLLKVLALANLGLEFFLQILYQVLELINSELLLISDFGDLLIDIFDFLDQFSFL
jgi:hypothetical protein